MATPAGGTLVSAGGLMWKASVVNPGAAHQRWFVLEEGNLACYKPNRTVRPDDESGVEIREVPLDVDATDILLGSDGKMFEVKAETAAAEEPRAFVFKAEDRDAWIKALKGESEEHSGMLLKKSSSTADDFCERYAVAKAGALTYYKAETEEEPPELDVDGQALPASLEKMRRVSFGMITSVQKAPTPLIFEFTAGGREQQLAAPDPRTEQEWILLLQQVCLLAHSDVMLDGKQPEPEQEYEVYFSTTTRVAVEVDDEGYEVTRVLTETVTRRKAVSHAPEPAAEEEGLEFSLEDGEEDSGAGAGDGSTKPEGAAVSRSGVEGGEGAVKPGGRVGAPTIFGVDMESSEEEDDDGPEGGGRARKSSIHVKVKDASVPNWKRGFKTGAVRKWKDAAKVDNYIWTKSGGGATKFDVSFGSEGKFKHGVKSKPSHRATDKVLGVDAAASAKPKYKATSKSKAKAKGPGW